MPKKCEKPHISHVQKFNNILVVALRHFTKEIKNIFFSLTISVKVFHFCIFPKIYFTQHIKLPIQYNVLYNKLIISTYTEQYIDNNIQKIEEENYYYLRSKITK